MKKPPHTVTVYTTFHGKTYSEDVPHKNCTDALDFLERGISWGNPHIKSARLYDDTGEPGRHEDAETMKVFKR